jgi:hypothetical protein
MEADVLLSQETVDAVTGLAVLSVKLAEMMR